MSRASLAALVKFELDTSRVPSDHPLVAIRRRVLALIEGSDPASPEPRVCGDENCTLVGRHPADPASPEQFEYPAGSGVWRDVQHGPAPATEPPADEVTRIAVRLPPGGLTLAFGGTPLEAAQALYDAGLRAEPMCPTCGRTDKHAHYSDDPRYATEPRSLSEPLDHLRALSDAATPGPWCVDAEDSGAFGTIFQGREWTEDAPWLFDRATEGRVADSRLVVAAVNYVRTRLATDPSAPGHTHTARCLNPVQRSTRCDETDLAAHLSSAPEYE